MADNPDPNSYYPRAKVRLDVYFQDFHKRTLDGTLPKPPKAMHGLADPRAPLTYVRDPHATKGTRRWLLKAKEGGDGLGKPDPRLQHIEGIIPHEATLGRNGIRMADTLSLSIRYIDCPVDPRCVRGCGVEFYLGTVTGEEHARQVSGLSDEILPDTWVDANGVTRSNLRFTGFVDSWELDWRDKAEPLIHIKCRDNTQLLIDQEVPAKLKIDGKRALDEAVCQYLTHFAQFDSLAVEYRGTSDPPQYDGALAKTAFIPSLGPGPSKGGGGEGEKLSVWDFLTDICGALGHNIRLEGQLLIIQQPRDLMKNNALARPEDPFRGRGKAIVRQWIYGSDVSSMRITRSFVKTAPTNIEVRCYSTKQKKDLVARYPGIGNRVADSKPTAPGASEKWKEVYVSGIESEKTLRIIAQNYYEMLGRNEIKIALKTKDLASFGGDNTDPDALDMVPGDDFELLIYRDEKSYASLTTIEAELSVMDRSVEFLKRLGFPKAFAEAYSESYTSAGFLTRYKVKGMNLTWSADTGVSLDIEGINLIEVNADVALEPEKKT